MTNGVVYVGSEDNNVYALNASTGALLWSYTTGGIVVSMPAVANGVVYITSADNNLYALNATTGTVVWSYNIGSGNWQFSSPAVANGVVYVGSKGGLVRIRAGRQHRRPAVESSGSRRERLAHSGEWRSLFQLGQRQGLRSRPEEGSG